MMTSMSGPGPAPYAVSADTFPDWEQYTQAAPPQAGPQVRAYAPGIISPPNKAFR